MTLNEFRDAVQKHGFKVWRNGEQITVDYDNQHCAHIDMSKDTFARIDTEKLEGVDLDERKDFLLAVTEFVITPADKRNEKVIAKHNTNMYVREVECWNSGMNIVFTCDKEKADQYITYAERDVLDKLFGKAVSYEEIYSVK